MKKFLVLAILLGSFTASFLIVRNGEKPRKMTNFMIEIAGKNNDPKFQYEASVSNKTRVLFDENQAAISQTSNLTNNLAYEITRNLVQQNPEGAKVINGSPVLNAPNINLEDYVGDNKNLFAKEYKLSSIKDIIVDGDDTKEAQMAYLKKITEIFDENFKPNDTKELKNAMIKFVDNSDATALRKYTAIIPKYINSLLNIKTPLQWREFHLSNVNLWQKKFTTLSAIADINNDPLKAMLAMEELEIITEENSAIQRQAEKQFKQLGLLQ